MNKNLKIILILFLVLLGFIIILAIIGVKMTNEESKVKSCMLEYVNSLEKEMMMEELDKDEIEPKLKYGKTYAVSRSTKTLADVVDDIYLNDYIEVDDFVRCDSKPSEGIVTVGEYGVVSVNLVINSHEIKCNDLENNFDCMIK